MQIQQRDGIEPAGGRLPLVRFCSRRRSHRKSDSNTRLQNGDRVSPSGNPEQLRPINRDPAAECTVAQEKASYCPSQFATVRATARVSPTQTDEKGRLAPSDSLWRAPAPLAFPPGFPWNSGGRPRQSAPPLEETSYFPAAQHARRLRELREHRRTRRC